MNNYGQLGNGTTTNRNTPTQILVWVSQIAGGYNHSLILKSDGSLHTFGRNNYGQLGDGTVTNKNTPLKFSLLGFHKLPLGITTHLFLSRMDLSILLVIIIMDNWGMVQIRAGIHPLRFLLPESLKLPLDIAIHLFLSRMDPYILLDGIAPDS